MSTPSPRFAATWISEGALDSVTLEALRDYIVRVMETSDGLGPSERDQILCGTARRFYRLDEQLFAALTPR